MNRERKKYFLKVGERLVLNPQFLNLEEIRTAKGLIFIDEEQGLAVALPEGIEICGEEKIEIVIQEGEPE